MRRLSIVLALVALVTAVAPSTGYAQQSLNFYVGGFIPRGEDARDRDDVLVNNLDFLSFDVGDFKGVTVGAEYLVGLGEWLEGGLGVGIYRRTVETVYSDFENANGAEIEQDLKLRIVPFTATVRFLPLGRSRGVQPYIGAGVAVLAYRYSETGEFVDFTDGSIFRDSFVSSGSATGPTILGGVRFPFGAWGIGGELRYQNAEGELDDDKGFSGSKIDLSGWTYAATFNVRF
jgi:Outer membrane protein beta-barrel domain